ncbi:MAG: DNA polymerase III subunit delta' [Methylovulum sp.]|nr:DNA polymerase III subunit delta' [Methylovulum sp.]
MTQSATLLPWQQQDWAHLAAYLAQKRIPQALLVIGKKGLGKQQLVKLFANVLLCKQPRSNGFSCGRCSGCLLFQAETHPDFFYIKPDENKTVIGIGQIRNLVVQLSLKPQFETYRVVIVSPADEISVGAANAFLKYLEEPTERTILILITDKPAKLPLTIVSRCQKLMVTVPDKDMFFSWIKARGPDVSDAVAETLFGLAQGAPLSALSYLNGQSLLLRNECFKDWLAIAHQQAHPVIVAEKWFKLPEALLVFWISSWLIDLIKCYYQIGKDGLYNPDLCYPLQALSQRLEPKNLYKFYDLLLTTRQYLHTQINKQLMFEEILIQWFELNQDK